MKRQFQAFAYKVINQSEDTLDVFIDGIIVDAETQQILKDWFGDETSVSYKSFRDQVLNAKPKNINVYINSGGGMVTDAMAIHDFLVDQENKGVTVNRTGRGIIASAATYLLIGNNSSMSENSMFMIHNVSGGAYGDVNMLENYAASMRKFNDNIVNFYSKATGLSETVISNMMDKETWMTATEAKDKGFVKNVTGKVDFTNKIKPEHWPFEDTAVLNAYNSSVKVPSENKEEGEHKSFFSNLQNEFMKLFDSLKGAVKNGKEDKAFEKIENRDAILDMVEKVLGPVVNKIDEVLAVKNEDKPKTEDKEESSTEAKVEEKKDEGKKEDKPEENEELKNIKAEIANMKNENEKLRNSLAAVKTKPDSEKANNTSLDKVKVEYEN